MKVNNLSAQAHGMPDTSTLLDVSMLAHLKEGGVIVMTGNPMNGIVSTEAVNAKGETVKTSLFPPVSLLKLLREFKIPRGLGMQQDPEVRDLQCEHGCSPPEFCSEGCGAEDGMKPPEGLYVMPPTFPAVWFEEVRYPLHTTLMWLCLGRSNVVTFRYEKGQVVCGFIGWVETIPPKEIMDEAEMTGKPQRWNYKGREYIVSTGTFPDEETVVHVSTAEFFEGQKNNTLTEEAQMEQVFRNPLCEAIVKTGRSETIFGALEAALRAKPLFI